MRFFIISHILYYRLLIIRKTTVGGKNVIRTKTKKNVFIDDKYSTDYFIFIFTSIRDL